MIVTPARPKIWHLRWVVLVGCLALPSTTRALNISYGTNTGPQDFTMGPNWVGGAAPSSIDIPIISSVDGIVDYPYLNTSATVQRFAIADSPGTSGGLELRSGANFTTTVNNAHYVGRLGTGHLRIMDGATISLAGPFHVGWGDSTGRGNGTVTQSGGTYMTTTATGMTIGNSAATASLPASVGTYNLNGGSVTLGGSLIVGNSGIGTFNTVPGTTLNVASQIVVGMAGTGTFNMQGGAVTTLNYLQIGRTGTGSFIQSSGDLAVNRTSTDQGIVIAPFAGATGLYEISGGSLNVANTNSGVENGVVANTNNSAGTFRVIGNAATINIGSNFRQRGGSTLDLRIGAGISPLNVTQTATLDGALSVNFTTTPTVGQQFTILNYGSLAGVFAAFDDLVDSPVGTNSVKLSISYGSGSGDAIKLMVDSVQTAIPGDFDNDGDVDGADFVAWQTNFPTAAAASRSQGDDNGDGDVDGADFAAWQGSFPAAPGPGVSPVPEPAALTLVAISGLILLALRRRDK